MTAEVEKRVKCEVREGRFIEPCDTLNSMVEIIAPGFSRAKGIVRWTYTNVTTLQTSRIFFGMKSKDHPNGMLFNFCPWCGEQIDAPFANQNGDDE